MEAVPVYHEKISKVLENINKVIIGKEEVAVLSMTALLSEGHVLLEDVPGVGKTMLVRALAKSLDCEFKRIQFTPDLLPSDVTGVSIYNPKEMEFEFRPGPILGNILLADEINRASPKTQSAFLEAMEEHSVTVDGNTIHLPEPFFVMATQNPVDYQGTYPLPEAQLDRFLMKLKMGYPAMKDEVEMLDRSSESQPIENIEPVLSREELQEMQEEIKKVYIDQNLLEYIVDLVSKTRDDERLELGVSPRGSVALMRASKSFAFIRNRDYVLPDDIKYLAPFVLAHRLILHPEAKYRGMANEEVVHSIIEVTNVPIRKDLS
jgi:MoxR-like ATPase